LVDAASVKLRRSFVLVALCTALVATTVAAIVLVVRGDGARGAVVALGLDVVLAVAMCVLGFAGLRRERTVTELVEQRLAERDAAELAKHGVLAEQDALRRVATAVAAESSPETILAMALDELQRLLRTSGGLVLLRDETTETIEWDAAVPDGPTLTAGSTLVAASVGLDVPAVATPVPPTHPRALADSAASGRSRQARWALPDDGPVARFAVVLAATITAGGRRRGLLAPAFANAGEIPPRAPDIVEGMAELIGLSISGSEARARLAHAAQRDSLTGLVNHRAFQDRLGAEVERARRHGLPLSLVMLDLDHFKAINDAHGHPIGDAVLVEVAQRLTQIVRRGEVLARVGGEEFAWLVTETDGAGAHAAAERARRAVAAEPFSGVGALTLSAGVADLRDAANACELYRLADGALYEAKAAGRDQTVRHMRPLSTAALAS